MLNKVKNYHGFTLVEVIVVIAIISLIASITIPSFIGYIDNSRDKTTRKSIETILDSAETECSYKRYKDIESLSDEIEQTFKTSAPVGSSVDAMIVISSDETDGVTTRLEEETKIHNLNSDGQIAEISISILKENDSIYKVDLNAVCESISVSRTFNPAVRIDAADVEEPSPTPIPTPSSDIDMENISDYIQGLFFKDGAVDSDLLSVFNTDADYSDGNSMISKMINVNNVITNKNGYVDWNLFDNYSHFVFKTSYFNNGTDSAKKMRLNNYIVLTFMNVYVQKCSDILGIPSSFTVSDSGTYKPYFYFKDMSTRDILEVDTNGNFVNLDDIIICAYDESNYFFTDESIWSQTNIKYIDGDSFESYAHLVYYPDKTSPGWYMLSDSEKGQKIDGIYNTYDKISSSITGGAIIKADIN